MASILSTSVVPGRSPHSGFGSWLSQGAAAGAVTAFLFVVAELLFGGNPYNFLLIPAFPLILFYGLLYGTFKSFIIWLSTKIFRRRLGIVSRVAIALVLVGFLIGILWWRWFVASPVRSMYYSGLTPSAVASLEGVKAIRLAVSVSSSTVGNRSENLTEAQLSNLITYKLMDTGIDVVSIDSRASAQATLYVHYSYSNDAKQPDVYTSDCHLRLTQDVVLHRDPHIKTEAPTWEYQNGSLIAGMPHHAQINDAVDQFVRDYNRANSSAPDDQYLSEETRRTSQLILSCACLIISAIVFGVVVGSNLQPLRTLMYGVGNHSSGVTILAVISGLLLRMWVLLLFMDSLLMLIATLQTNSQHRDMYSVLLFIGHSTLCIITAFSRFKFVTLAVLSLIAISPAIYFLTLQEIHWFFMSIIIGHIALWTLFLLSRSSFVYSAFSNFKQELRYYLID